MAANISSLVGWTVDGIAYSAGYYTLTLVKGGRTRRIQVAASDVFDDSGLRFTNNVEGKRS